MARSRIARKGLAIRSTADKSLSEDSREPHRASSRLKRLIVQALERSVVTVDEIKSAMAAHGYPLDRLDDLIALFEDMGVTVDRSENYGAAVGARDDPGSAAKESIPITKARQALAELCNRVAYGGERLVIARRGKARAALVPIEDLESLEALEDAVDLTAARKSIREAKKTGAKSLEEVLHGLGLDAEVA